MEWSARLSENVRIRPQTPSRIRWITLGDGGQSQHDREYEEWRTLEPNMLTDITYNAQKEPIVIISTFKYI